MSSREKLGWFCAHCGSEFSSPNYYLGDTSPACPVCLSTNIVIQLETCAECHQAVMPFNGTYLSVSAHKKIFICNDCMKKQEP